MTTDLPAAARIAATGPEHCIAKRDDGVYADPSVLGTTLAELALLAADEPDTEALERLVECYLALGIPQEAQKAAAVLGRNYPGSEWYHRSYKLIARHTPQTAPQS